jgi:hypothetical protein
MYIDHDRHRLRRSFLGTDNVESQSPPAALAKLDAGHDIDVGWQIEFPAFALGESRAQKGREE